MRSISRLLSKLLKMLLAGTFTIIVAACYGVYMNYRLFFHISDPGGSPIPDLHLTLKDGTEIVDVNRTDLNGEAYLDPWFDQSSNDKDYIVTIVDEDGSENSGDFQPISMNVTVPGDNDTFENVLEYSVTMYPVKIEETE